jgi:hypothetical protein
VASLGRRYGVHHSTVLYALNAMGIDTSMKTSLVRREAARRNRAIAWRSKSGLERVREQYLAASKLKRDPKIEHLMELAAPRKSRFAA